MRVRRRPNGSVGQKRWASVHGSMSLLAAQPLALAGILIVVACALVLLLAGKRERSAAR